MATDPTHEEPPEQSAPMRIEQAGSLERLRWMREERRNSFIAVLVLLALTAALGWAAFRWLGS